MRYATTAGMNVIQIGRLAVFEKNSLMKALCLVASAESHNKVASSCGQILLTYLAKEKGRLTQRLEGTLAGSKKGKGAESETPEG